MMDSGREEEVVVLVGVNEGNIRATGYKELMTEAKTFTTAALPRAFPPPSAPKIPDVGSQSGINPSDGSTVHPHTPSCFPLIFLPWSQKTPNITKVLSLPLC